MNHFFTPQSWEEYRYWIQTNKKILNRMNELIGEVLRSPCEGIGKPEPHRQALAGYWSRRITEEHRMVYRLRYHSKKEPEFSTEDLLFNPPSFHA